MTDPAQLRSVASAAGGLVELTVVRPAILRDLTAQAGAGNPAAALVIRAAARVLDAIKAGAASNPVLCPSCHQPIAAGGADFTLAIVAPARPDAAEAFGFALCTVCCLEPDNVQAVAREVLGHLFPGARVLSDVHQPGHA